MSIRPHASLRRVLDDLGATLAMLQLRVLGPPGHQ
jgi:hypothetical protein